jgi:hypothetical protein
MKKFHVYFLAFVSLSCFAQEKLSFNYYKFSFQQPKDWMMIDKDGIAQNLDRFKTSDEFRQQAEKNLKNDATRVSFYKYDPKKVSGIIPTIHVILKDTKVKTFENFKKSVVIAEKKAGGILTNYKMLSTQDIEIAEHKSIKIKSVYDFVNPKGEGVVLSSTTIYIYKGNQYASLTLIDEPVREENSKVLEAMVKTIIFKT